jgi:hypothetical protein
LLPLSHCDKGGKAVTGRYEEELGVARNLALAAGRIILYHYRGKAQTNRRFKTIRQGGEEILHEPVSMLDVSIRNGMLNLYKRLTVDMVLAGLYIFPMNFP